MSPLRVLVLLALLVCAPAGAADRADTEAGLAELRAKIAELKIAQQQKRAEESSAREALAAAEQAMGEKQRALKQTRKDLGDARKRLKALDSDRVKHEKQKSQSLRALQKQVQAQFRAGEHAPVKLLLMQEDPALIGQMLHFFERVQKARLQELVDLKSALGALSAVEQARLEEVARLGTLETQLSRENEGLRALRQERAASVKTLADALRDDDARLAALLRDESALSDVLQSLEQAARKLQFPKGTPFRELKGKLAWPARGKLLQKFGDQRYDGRMRWNGVLIDAREGQDVAAISHGRVVFADWLRGFGLMTIIDHGDDYMSLYGHSQSLNKRVGDWVEAGEVIATVGNSGGQTQASLYFEVRHRGQAIDPRAWFK